MSFIRESCQIIRDVAVSPFRSEVGGDAWEGVKAQGYFLFVAALSLLVLALFPISIPGLVWLQRASERRYAAQRAAIAARHAAFREDVVSRYGLE
jgi:hypothetical protein